MIFLECLYNLGVHISELTAVALVKDDNAMLAHHLMPFVLGHEVIQLLNSRDDDFILVVAAFFVSVLKLSPQYSCRSVAVGRTFFKALIFFHCLIVKVFSANYEQNLVHMGGSADESCAVLKEVCVFPLPVLCQI